MVEPIIPVMARRIGSLAARALIVFGIGTAVVTSIVVTGAWLMVDRLMDDASAIGSSSASTDASTGAEPNVSVNADADASAVEAAELDLLLIRWLLIVGGSLVVATGVTLLWMVLRRDVLSPLRQLQDTAERVSRGEQSARVQVRSRDEVESFADSLNRMLDANERVQRQLSGMNQALDLKIGELSEANVSTLDGWPLIVIVDDSEFCAKTLNNFLWMTFTRSNPASDIYGVHSFTESKHWGCRSSLVIDARVKPHMAPPLVTDPEITRRVDELGAPGGPLHGVI